MDKVRQLASSKPIAQAVTTSSGSHITLPEWYGSHVTGMIVPKTKVGRLGGTRVRRGLKRALGQQGRGQYL